VALAAAVICSATARLDLATFPLPMVVMVVIAPAFPLIGGIDGVGGATV
jgi:hypothetical protein